MTATTHTASPPLLLAALLLYATLVPWRDEPRRFDDGRVVLDTCDRRSPVLDAKCWACHGELK